MAVDRVSLENISTAAKLLLVTIHLEYVDVVDRLCNLHRDHAWHLHCCMPPPGHEKFPTRIPRPSPGLSRVRTRLGQRAGQRLVTVMV